MPRTRSEGGGDTDRRFRELPAAAIRHVLRNGYHADDLWSDVLAGMVVGVVALPLSMALAIAAGVAPQHGLYTAIVAGTVVALLGGSRFQVSGPTAAFVLLLSPIAAKFGLGGLLLATLGAGFILVALGLVRLGALIQFVPYPVTTGFTTGIAVVIATLQIKDFLGLSIESTPDHYLERVVALADAMPTAQLDEIAIGVLTLAILLLWPRINTRIPAPLVALLLGAMAAATLHHLVPGFDVATIESRFSYFRDGVSVQGIPNLPPMFAWPWSQSGAGGAPFEMSFAVVRELAPSALAIAMLGAIESLLSAVVADGLTGTKHDPDAELIAQGVGNIIAPFFGGIAATGAIARTATSIRAGARSPVASVVHAGFVLAAMLTLSPVLARLPMASLAALLLLVAWNMSEVKHFGHIVRVAPKGDVFVLLTCFGLTVVFDMVVSVTAGVLLAALLFMRRMAQLSSVRLVGPEHGVITPPLPPGVMLYDVGGPLFFGAAQKAMSALDTVEDGVRALVLDLRDVPIVDTTGLVGLESALARLQRMGVHVILAGVQPQPAELFARAGLCEVEGKLVVRESFDEAIELARACLAPKAGHEPSSAGSISPR
jgi:SulP family sulfate permease